MIKPITPPHIDAEDTRAQLSQIKRYLFALSRDLTVILTDLESRIAAEDGDENKSE